MARELQRSVIPGMAVALAVAALTVACQAAGGSGAPAAARSSAAARAAQPAVSAAPAANTARAAGAGRTGPTAAGQGPTGPGPFASDAADRALAASLADGIQRGLRPPPGSRKLSGPPAGTWRDVEVPGGMVPADGEVLTGTWWRVPGEPSAVLAWFLAHTPPPWYGGGRGSNGPAGPAAAGQRPPAGAYWSWNVSFQDFHTPAVISSEQLIVEEIENSAGQVYTRVDALVSWIPPRPAAERVPDSAQVVTITAEPRAGAAMPPGSPVTVTDPVKVARIAALVNGLYRGSQLCAPPPPTPDRIKLSFSAARGGPALATADADFRGCQQVRFSVPGAPSLPLLAEINDRLVPAILSVAGVHWFA